MRARAIIDLAALQHNFQRVKYSAPNQKVMAVVKADAYHHGAVRVCRALKAADYFGVATLNEAIAIADVARKPIVNMFGFFDKEDLGAIAKHDFHTVVHNWHQVSLLKLLTTSRPISIWIKVNTGMNRYGFEPTELPEVIRVLSDLPQCRLHAVMSHFACANQPGHAMIETQRQQWLSLVFQGLATSLCNSAAILTMPDIGTDIVRPGMMLYGASPISMKTAADFDLQPVMTLQGKVISTRSLAARQSVGYGAQWHAEKPTDMALITLGYADGYPQHAEGSPVLINGHHAKVIGTTAMDCLAVDITGVPDVNIGDWATFWGDGLPVEEVASYAERSVYDLLTDVSDRVIREYQ